MIGARPLPATSMSVFKISPTVQPYSWGKQGSSSKVAQLASASEIPGFVLEEGKAYAEVRPARFHREGIVQSCSMQLWMGTHPTSPSTLFSASSSAILLSDYLKVNPSLIGPSIPSKFVGAKDGNLPFLFKVLSIQKALSIQTHPDLETAKELHRTLPHIYKGHLSVSLNRWASIELLEQTQTTSLSWQLL